MEKTRSPKPSEENHKHWKAEDLDSNPNCPECIKEKEKISNAYVKKMLEQRKEYHLVCDPKRGGCGFPVSE